MSRRRAEHGSNSEPAKRFGPLARAIGIALLAAVAQATAQSASAPLRQPPAPQPTATAAGANAPATPAGAAPADAPDSSSFVDAPAPGIEELADGLYVVTGLGGNVVARVTPEGVFVAGELTPAADAIAAWVESVADPPVRYVLQTHRHGSQPVALPAPWQAAKLVAQQAALPLAGGGARVPPQSPDRSFTRGLSLFLGAAEVQLHHFGPAHTGSDVAVLFPDLDILYAGDLVGRGPPYIDYAAGGSSRGWVRTLNGLLALDFETVVPGAGPALTKHDLQTFRDRFVTLRMRTMQLLYRNVPPREALALLQTADLDWPPAPGGPFAARSFAALYDELAMERDEAREAAATGSGETAGAAERP